MDGLTRAVRVRRRGVCLGYTCQRRLTAPGQGSLARAAGWRAGRGNRPRHRVQAGRARTVCRAWLGGLPGHPEWGQDPLPGPLTTSGPWPGLQHPQDCVGGCTPVGKGTVEPGIGSLSAPDCFVHCVHFPTQRVLTTHSAPGSGRGLGVQRREHSLPGTWSLCGWSFTLPSRVGGPAWAGAAERGGLGA